MIPSGRHFLQIPGPTNVPDRVLRAMHRAILDHRGAEFAALGKEVLDGLRPLFQTAGPVIVYPASGTGGWEAAIVNTLSAGDRLMMFETGHFDLLTRVRRFSSRRMGSGRFDRSFAKGPDASSGT